MGKLVKLFGKVAPPETEAIADAFRIANGFFPVRVVYPRLDLPFPASLEPMLPADLAPAPYTNPSLVVLSPAVLMLRDPAYELFCMNSMPPDPIVGNTKASDLNCSTLKRTSRILSIGTLLI